MVAEYGRWKQDLGYYFADAGAEKGCPRMGEKMIGSSLHLFTLTLPIRRITCDHLRLRKSLNWARDWATAMGIKWFVHPNQCTCSEPITIKPAAPEISEDSTFVVSPFSIQRRLGRSTERLDVFDSAGSWEEVLFGFTERIGFGRRSSASLLLRSSGMLYANNTDDQGEIKSLTWSRINEYFDKVS